MEIVVGEDARDEACIAESLVDRHVAGATTVHLVQDGLLIRESLLVTFELKVQALGDGVGHLNFLGSELLDGIEGDALLRSESTVKPKGTKEDRSTFYL